MNRSSPLPVVWLVRNVPQAGRRPSGRPERVWVRTATDADLAAWVQLQNEILAERGSPRRWGEAECRRELTSRPWWSPERLLLACRPDDPAPLGCVAIEIDSATASAQLHWLAVRPEARRRGVATRLLDEAERRARSAGCRQLRAESLRQWTAAVSFYIARGFREGREGASADHERRAGGQ
jgi:ribosomal protein S18 acetylase RimI-like enzyme